MKGKLIVLMVLFALALVACGGNSRTTIYSSDNFNPATENNLIEAYISTQMSSNSLSVEMNLEGGRVDFQLSSPDGQVQWEESFTAPANYQHMFDLDVTPGMWKLEIKFVNATGDYDIEWVAK